MATHTLITDRIINDLRATAEQVMADTCVIYTDTLVSDGFSGQTGTAVARGTVSCFVSRAALVTPEFRENAGQIAPDVSWLALFPHDTVLYDKDHVIWSKGTIQVVAVIGMVHETVRRAFCRNANDFNP